MKPSEVLFLALTGFILGVPWAFFFDIGWVLVAVLVLALLAFWGRLRAGLFLLALVVGLGRGWVHIALLPVPPAAQVGEYVAFSGEVRDVASGRFIVGTDFGAVKVFGSSAVFPGDVVRVRCQVRGEDTVWRRRDMWQGIVLSCTERETVAEGARWTLARMLFGLRTFVLERMRSVLPAPERDLALGLVLGADEGMPRALREDFRTSGVSHITAVSGSNVSVFTASLYALLVATCLRRRRAVLVTGAVLLVYVLLVGGAGAVLRAAVMGGLVLVARYFGRAGSAGRLLLVSIGLLLALWPFLFFDVGFQLSVAATAGLLFLPRVLSPFFRWIPFAFLRELVTVTVAAFLATVPISAYTFGKISVVGLVANLFIVPLVSLAFPLILLFTLLALASFSLASLLAPLFALPLSLIILLAQAFARVPGATVAFTATIYGVLAAYLGLAWWAWSAYDAPTE